MRSVDGLPMSEEWPRNKCGKLVRKAPTTDCEIKLTESREEWSLFSRQKSVKFFTS